MQFGAIFPKIFMNSIILDNNLSLSASSPKLEHIKKVLRAKDGDKIFAGIKNGPLYLCNIIWNADGSASFKPVSELRNPPCAGINMAVAFSRPQIAQRLLFEAACFGVDKLIFYPSDKSDSSYAKSALYASGEYGKWLEKGAEQACSTMIPDFKIAENFSDALNILTGASCAQLPILKLAPDPYEATTTLQECVLKSAHNGIRRKKSALILGGERGFSDSERRILRDGGFILCSLGDRILRTDTAAIAALSTISAVPFKSGASA